MDSASGRAALCATLLLAAAAVADAIYLRDGPPHKPQFRLTSTTTNSITIELRPHPTDSAPLHGYTIHYKPEFSEWETVQASSQTQNFTIENLRCGSRYQVYATAYNGIGTGDASDILNMKTKGAKPGIPEASHFIEVSSGSITLHLSAWSDGGCPILHFVVEYKKKSQTEWTQVSNNVKPGGNFVVLDLEPATWYHLRVTAHNNAGFAVAEYEFATLTITGGACTKRQFQCANGHCIPLTWMCDGEDDCDDNSDETSATCNKTRECTDHQFRCNNGRCIPSSWQCDNEKDCVDGSDEIPQACQQKKCASDEFTCRTAPGECVPLAWKCDDNPDCSDGSDEKACNETCRSDEFTCANSKCTQQHWVCDGDDDCGDRSDEKDCPKTTCAPDKEFSCSDNNMCINARWQCDGDLDCQDGSDEQGCTSTGRISHCLPFEFECLDKITCIHQHWVCDGGRDCPDGSDEDVSRCHNSSCQPDQFECRNRICIPGQLHCSGHADCSDGSDEENCTSSVSKCDPKTEFKCGSGICIPLSSVCDEKPDCPNWEDELREKCGKNECFSNNGGCSQKCVDTSAGYYCDCLPGYKLIDNHTCDDVNECEIPGTCSQECINEKGTFKCQCVESYLRDPRDPTRCKAMEGHASLLFARRHDIRRISLDNLEMTTIVNNTKSATALDFVFKAGMIFWTDVSNQKIYKASTDAGSDWTVVIKHQLNTPDGLAVDWIYNHIYWTDTGKSTIELANFEGNMRKILIKNDLEEPRAIAVNPLDGWMYWTDWGTNAKIERAGMDGAHRQTIVSYEVKWPNGLTLDFVKKRVYWVDAKLNVISSCNYDGSDRRVILYSPEHLQHPFSVTTFEDWVYWTDWNKHGIYKANKFTGKNVSAITATHTLLNPMAIHVYHSHRQPDGENHCKAVNGHCSHLCLPAPQKKGNSPKISCACPDGLQLLPDGLMCAVSGSQENDVTLHVSAKNHATSHTVNLDPSLKNLNITFITNIYQFFSNYCRHDLFLHPEK